MQNHTACQALPLLVPSQVGRVQFSKRKYWLVGDSGLAQTVPHNILQVESIPQQLELKTVGIELTISQNWLEQTVSAPTIVKDLSMCIQA